MHPGRVSAGWRSLVKASGRNLHEDPRDRQMLMVFRSDRLVRIQPGDLDAGREHWRDYYRLPGTSPNRPPAIAPASESQAERAKERY